LHYNGNFYIFSDPKNHQMKQVLFLLLIIFSLQASSQTITQTRSAANVTINYRPSLWINRLVSSFAANDNVYAYTKKSSGGFPLYFDHFGFSIPNTAVIEKIVASVRKHKAGKSEVKDYADATWFLKEYQAEGYNISYGIVMNDMIPWKPSETQVHYTSPSSGSDNSGNSYNWTPADINSSWFGFTFYPSVSIQGGGASIYIDEVIITVYYRLP